VLNEPELVFLDETTSWLYPIGRLLVRDLIRELRDRGVAVFLNSHLLGEVEATCDRVAFMKQGRVVHERRLAAQEAGLEVEVRASGLEDGVLGELSELGSDLRRDGDLVRLRIAREDALPEIARRLVARGARLYHLTAARPSLEAQFLEVMGEDQRPG